MAAPDPQIVREIAREHIRSGHDDIRVSILRRFSPRPMNDRMIDPWIAAVSADVEAATVTVTVSWPDEQPEADPVSGEQQDGAVGGEGSTHAASLRVFLDAHSQRRGHDVIASLATGNGRTVELTQTQLRAVLAEHNALAALLAELKAVLAEGNQRDRALALLLIRNGGQVEFTQAERVTAPQHGQLISYPNLVTGGLVLAFSADGETVGAPPETDKHQGNSHRWPANHNYAEPACEAVREEAGPPDHDEDNHTGATAEDCPACAALRGQS